MVIRILEAGTRRVSAGLDAVLHRLYGWRYNPLHQSGALAAWLLVVLTATGLYLLLVYRVGAPAESVRRLAADPWLGSWMRSLHRYATDAFVVAAVLHALRLFGQARAWGPRTRAWVTGVFLLGVGLGCAWTGFVMAWDALGARLALAGARLFDALPILSEPVSRIFLGRQPPPANFFFINLFIHIALPLAMGIGLWLHVSRVARPALAPPPRLRWAVTLALLVLAVVRPAALGLPATPLQLPVMTPLNLTTSWWLPVVERVSPSVAWAGFLVVTGLVLAVPWLTWRPRSGSWAPSVVDPRICTGCDQCTQDCPWEAISMVARTDGRPTLVALVDPERCVSCGICAGSCAPMGVGPPGRTGRDQLAALDATAPPGPAADAMAGRVVVLCCDQAPPAGAGRLAAEGAVLRGVPCVGALHTSVVERLLRHGAAGVLVAGCPPRDCAGREGPTWLAERVWHEREAELQARVDRRRVRVATLARGVEAEAVEAFRAFRRSLGALEAPTIDAAFQPETACEATPIEAGS